MHIVFSGMDGSGKSTQIKLLAASYQNRKVRVLWARGGYTPTFKAIKRFIKLLISCLPIKKLKKKSNGRSIASENLRVGLFGNKLFVRIWLMVSIIDLGIYFGIYLRYLKLRNFVVINDRYHIDTEVDFLLRFPKFFNPNGLLWRSIVAMAPRPNVAFLCLVDAETSISRSKLKNDRYTDSHDHLVKRYTLYKNMQHRGNWDWSRLDCSKAIDDVREDIVNELKKIYENYVT